MNIIIIRFGDDTLIQIWASILWRKRRDRVKSSRVGVVGLKRPGWQKQDKDEVIQNRMDLSKTPHNHFLPFGLSLSFPERGTDDNREYVLCFKNKEKWRFLKRRLDA